MHVYIYICTYDYMCAGQNSKRLLALMHVYRGVCVYTIVGLFCRISSLL